MCGPLKREFLESYRQTDQRLNKYSGKQLAHIHVQAEIQELCASHMPYLRPALNAIVWRWCESSLVPLGASRFKDMAIDFS